MIHISERPATDEELRAVYVRTQSNIQGAIGCYGFVLLIGLIGVLLYMRAGLHAVGIAVIALGVAGFVLSLVISVLNLRTKRRWYSGKDRFVIVRIEMPIEEAWKIEFTDRELERNDHIPTAERHACKWLMKIAPGRYALLDRIEMKRSPYTQNFVPRERLVAEWIRPRKGGFKALSVTSTGALAELSHLMESRDVPQGTYTLNGLWPSGDARHAERLLADLRGGFFDEMEIQDETTANLAR